MQAISRLLLAGAVAVSAFQAAGPAQAQQKLTIWWTKGFYESEDKALRDVVDRFQKKTGTQVELSLFATEDSVTKAVSAVEAGSPPDVGFGTTYDFRTTGRWAYEGKLEDVSAVVDPLKSEFLPIAYESVYLLNKAAGKRGVYAVPIEQQTMHFFYWEDMLQNAGFQDADVPKDWKPFWDFWCDKVQPALRKKGQRVYGIGLPSSVAASDTFYTFLSFVNAYDANPVDKDGKLTVDDPKVRQGLANALKDYAGITQRSCSPISDLTWTDTDNNLNFHNKTTVSTPNATLSIPGKYLEDKNEDVYKNKVRTLPLPNKPDGQPLPNLAAVKTAVVFADAPNKQGGKDFLKFLMEPDNLNPYVEGSLGRWFPVLKSGTERPFWTSGDDPHRLVAYKQFKTNAIPFQFVYDYRFTTINAENVWGRALARMIQDKIPAEQATDEMIKRIKELAPPT
jgi:multiple sugar transport system substrate-binding protein